MNSHKESSLRIWILIIGVLLILSLTGLGIVMAIQETTHRAEQAIQPISDLTSGLGTEVSKVMHPTPTVIPDPVTIIQEVRSLARLETIQYSVEKVITAETGQGAFGFLFGDRLLFVAHGVVISGIDLGKLGPEDLSIKNGVLYVSLPEPEIFLTTLDNDKSYVYNRQTGVLTRGDINLETNARRVAEDEIQKAALEDGILKLARENGENYLYRLFISLGFQEVIFVNPTPQP